MSINEINDQPVRFTDIEAARLLLEKMGVSTADLLNSHQTNPNSQTRTVKWR
jgi:hypothetical protein